MWALLACSGTFVAADPADPDAPAPAEDLRVEGAPAVVINEVQTANASTVLDPRLAYADWVELFNAGDEPVSLAELSLAEEGGAAWIGAGRLGPGERKLLWAGTDLPFGLDAGGERLTLAWNGAPIDRLATGELPEDTSWARFPDGGAWAATARPTPGGPNGSAPTATLDPSEALFDRGAVHPFHLVLPASSEAALRADPYTDVPASLAYDGAWLPEVGVRIKGVYGSLRTLDAKASLKVDVNQYADQRLRGLESLTFNNMVQDPSYTHETLAYLLWREAGLPAPRTGWADLHVNGEYWGLYTLVETVDDRLLARYWADPTGPLYEGAYGDDFTVGGEGGFELDEGTSDLSELTDLAALLAGAPTEEAVATLDTLVDMDAFLANMALEALTYHWDGYTTANNYRVYHDPTSGRFTMIPWGTDQTFANAWYGPYDGGGVLLDFCLADAGCLARYDDALREMADVMDATDLAGELDAAQALLAERIAADPRREHDDATIAAYVATTRDVIATSPERIRAAVAGNH